jgi:hypothetical protein
MTKKLFDLSLNATPDLTKRVAIGNSGELSENMTLQQFFDFVTNGLDVYDKGQVNVLFENYLAKNNLAAYTPTLSTHPATKGYVDGDYNNVEWVSMIAGTNATILSGSVAQRNGMVTITCRFKMSSGTSAGDILLKLPTSISTSSVIQDFGATNGNTSGDEGDILYIPAGSRNIITRGGYVSANNEFSIHITYPLF